MQIPGPRIMTMLGMALVIVAGAGLLAPSVLTQTSQPVSDPTSALASGVSANKGYADKLIEDMQARLGKNARDYAALAQLGVAYLQKARETNDPTFYTQAENALNRSLQVKADNYDATASLGSLELSRHNFSKAEEWGKKARQINPQKAYAYGVIGDAQIELGDYDNAVTTFQEMVDLRPDLGSYSRVSYARELYGDVPGAIEAMRQAVQAGSPAAENTAWSRVQLGNLYYNSKQLDKAEQEFKQALYGYPNYIHAEAGLAQVRVAQSRKDEAVKLYKQAVAAVPLPQYLTALGDLYTDLGNPKAAREQYDLVLYIYGLFEANGVNADAEKAAFLADMNMNTAEAVRLAQQAAAVRKDIHTQDTLAWSLYRAGKYEEARQAMTSAMRLGTQNPLFFFHMGMIQTRLGDKAGARLNLQKALDINPYFSLKYAKEAAETLKKLGN